MSDQTCLRVPALTEAALRRVLLDLAPLAVLDGDRRSPPLQRGTGGEGDGLTRTESASASGQLQRARDLSPRLALVRDQHGADVVAVLLWLAQRSSAHADVEAFALLFGRHHGPVEVREAFEVASERATSTAAALADCEKRLTEARGARRGLVALTPEWALAAKYVADCEKRHTATTGRAVSAAKALAKARAELLTRATARLSEAVDAWLQTHERAAA
jgi:hypothetical protein